MIYEPFSLRLLVLYLQGEVIKEMDDLRYDYAKDSKHIREDEDEDIKRIQSLANHQVDEATIDYSKKYAELRVEYDNIESQVAEYLEFSKLPTRILIGKIDLTPYYELARKL